MSNDDIFRKTVKRRDDSEVRRHLKTILVNAIILILFVALGVFIGINSIDSVRTDINQYVLQFGSSDPAVPILQGLLNLVIAEVALNAVILALLIFGLVIVKKSQRELTRRNVVNLRNIMFATLIVSVIFFVFEIVAINSMAKSYQMLNIEQESNITSYIMQAVRLALYVTMFFKARSALIAFQKYDQPFDDVVSENQSLD